MAAGSIPVQGILHGLICQAHIALHHIHYYYAISYMESTTLLWIFLGVWGGLLLLYVLYKVCGGRIVDCFSCECFRGPCCDCWAGGGTLSDYDREWESRP